MLDFCLLGPLEVRSDGRALELGGHKLRILLVLLLLESNRVVSSDRLIDAIWEEQPTATAQKGLQVLVSQLRKVVGKERVQSRSPGYALTVLPGELDLERFQNLKAEGRLEEALALWRGQPLADFSYHRFAQGEIARLEELHLAALEDRIDGDLAAGRHAELVGELEALCSEFPSRERLVAQLLRALYRSGRQADALVAYQSARRALVDELGIEPAQPLRELQQQILRHDPALDFAKADDEAHVPFVGRADELAVLAASLEDAVAGRGRLVLLEGEPGIGKSYLADRFLRRARRRGAVVLTGRCWEAGGAPAYWPWVQSLRGLVHDGDASMPNLEEPVSAEPETSRFRLFDELTTFLRETSRERPIVLFIDDLHAADPSSLLLLRFVAREVASMRMVVLGAYRNVDPAPSEDLSAALTELAREASTRVISLTGLSEQEVADYVSLAAPELDADRLAGDLREETEGNALFVAEMVRLLGEEGSSGDTFAVPAGVRSVIARRAANLSDGCQRVLVAASVLGREFVPSLLARVVGVEEPEILDLLDEAMRSNVVAETPDGPGRLRFAHVLIRDSFYDSVTGARRIGLHRQVIAALESLYGDDPGHHLTELANHALAGGDFERTLLYAQRAADRALALLAYEEAARLYQMAWDAIAHCAASDETRGELLLALGDARLSSGDTAGAKAAFLDAAKLARAADDGKMIARAAVGYGGRIVWIRAGSDERLVPLLEEALRVLPEAEMDLRSRLLSRLSGALRDDPSRERRDALSREAVKLARATGVASSLAHALDARGHTITGPDCAEELLDIGRELCEVATREGDRERIAAGYNVCALALLMLGDISAAEQEIVAAHRIADELKQVPLLWEVTADLALLALGTGRFDEAADFAERALELGREALPDAAVPIHVMHMYALRESRGELEDTRGSVRELVERYPVRVVFRCALIHLDARVGRSEMARSGLRELGAGKFAAVPFDQEWLFGMALLAEAATTISDPEAASPLYELLAPWAHLNAVDQAEGMRGSVHRYLALLAGLLDNGSAPSHFEAAIIANERMGLRPWVARTEEDYGRFLLTSGDETGGAALVEHATAAYEQLGMTADRERVAELVGH